MHISSWAAMTKRHRGRQWHCRTIRTINPDYVSTPQAMQWPDGWSKHIRQWLGCGNSIPRYVFPISKTCWALIGGPKTSRDTKKDCGEPGCPNDRRSRSTDDEEERDFRLWHCSAVANCELSLLSGIKRNWTSSPLRAAFVKVFGCRPHDGGAACTGPASANLQGRKPREGIRGWCGVRYGDLSAADEVCEWSRAA